MSADIVGLQQIIITLVFLSVLVGVLFFLKRKGSFIRANLHGDKRIQILEESAISPTEKLRLLSIDGQMFVMASAKGMQPVLNMLHQGPSSNGRDNSRGSVAPKADFAGQFSSQAGLSTPPAQTGTAQAAVPLELTQPVSAPAKRSEQVGEADVKAFQEKFKSWRQR